MVNVILIKVSDEEWKDKDYQEKRQVFSDLGVNLELDEVNYDGWGNKAVIHAEGDLKPIVEKVEAHLEKVIKNVEVSIVDRVKCICCDGWVDEDETVAVEAGILCYGCDESERSEAPATIIYHEDGYDNEDWPHVLGNYIDETEGEFTLDYHRIDGWRGYYVVESETFVEIHDDNILSHSEDEAELAEFDEMMKEFLNEIGVRYARVFTRSSNVFSTGYGLWVDAEHFEAHKDEIKEAVAIAVEEHRDEWKYMLTAMTGKDPKETTSEDAVFTLLASTIIGAE